MNEVLSTSSTSVPSQGQLMLEWTGEGQPQEFRQKMVLEGSAGPKSLHIRYQPSASKCAIINYLTINYI